jgi:hypothetical protein
VAVAVKTNAQALNIRILSLERGGSNGGNNEGDDRSQRETLLETADVGKLFQQIQDLNPNDVPQDVRDEIMKRIRDEAPSEAEVRMGMMGITSFTKAGFALAGVLLLCNAVLGNGWAGNLLGLNDGTDEVEMATRRSVTARQSNFKVPLTFEVPRDWENNLPKEFLYPPPPLEK